MITLAESDAETPKLLFECIAVASPCKCIVALWATKIPLAEFPLNTQLSNLADVKLPYTILILEEPPIPNQRFHVRTPRTWKVVQHTLQVIVHSFGKDHNH